MDNYRLFILDSAPKWAYIINMNKVMKINTHIPRDLEAKAVRIKAKGMWAKLIRKMIEEAKV